ncbi:MAG: anhydro-N-acetylmuramic acid kinase [Bacteroidota bacterium]
MFYKAIGLMSGSSLDGLDLVFVELQETGGEWTYTIHASACYAYDQDWNDRLKNAIDLSAYEYLLLHCSYGKYIGEQVNRFIEEFGIEHQVQLIASHGHTSFHAPTLGMTGQLGDGATIAAITGINVVSDLRMMDVALGGQGAPIVPIGEKLLWKEYAYLLNLGGIANISANRKEAPIAFDICAANRVLNLLCNELGMQYDAGGATAATGNINTALLTALNNLPYYQQPYPKSLANNFGTDLVYPMIKNKSISVPDALRTYTEHIAMQVGYAINLLHHEKPLTDSKLLITGGGTHNAFLVKRIATLISGYGIETIVPDKQLVDYKEAIIMALLGVLRWREENTVLHSVTGAKRSSIGGAVWIGQEA